MAINKENMTKPKLGDYRVVEKWRRGKDEKPEKEYHVEKFVESNIDIIDFDNAPWYRKIFGKPVYTTETRSQWITYIGIITKDYSSKDIAHMICRHEELIFKTKKEACREKAELEKKALEIAKNKAIPLPEDKVVTCK